MGLFSRLFGLEKVSIQYRNYRGEKKTFVAKKILIELPKLVQCFR